MTPRIKKLTCLGSWYFGVLTVTVVTQSSELISCFSFYHNGATGYWVTPTANLIPGRNQFPATSQVSRHSIRGSSNYVMDNGCSRNFLNEIHTPYATVPGTNDTRGGVSTLSMTFPVDLRGKTAFIAGVGDSSGYGWSIAKHLYAAGARIAIGTWPPVMGIFKKSLESGKFDADAELPDGRRMTIEKIYSLDATFDTPDDVPESVKTNKRYVGAGGYTISEVAQSLQNDFGKIDILVHSLANGPEVTKPLLETSRAGYLAAASASSYSMVSLLKYLAPFMNDGGSALSLTYIASERVIPGYGGGMSSAKAALESDTRTLAWEAGRKYGIRVNTISAGPLKSRAAAAIGKSGDKSFIDLAIHYSNANAPLQKVLKPDHVGSAALFLLSPMAEAMSGVTIYVDNGLHSMGQAVDSKALRCVSE